jgi:hypothetical protein
LAMPLTKLANFEMCPIASYSDAIAPMAEVLTRIGDQDCESVASISRSAGLPTAMRSTFPPDMAVWPSHSSQ